jgi:hypothetical protein
LKPLQHLRNRKASVKFFLTFKNFFGQRLCRALTGLCRWCDPCPRALPWAGMSRPFRADSNIADPTDPTDPTDLLDPFDPSYQSEKPIDQIINPRAIPSVKAAPPYKNFRTTIPQNLLFLEKIFYGRWTGTRMDTMDGIDKNGLLNGQWTMDNGMEWTRTAGDIFCTCPFVHQTSSPSRPFCP